MVPVDRVKCFHDFHHRKFKHANVDLELFVISTYKKFAFQQLQGGLHNEFDGSSFELKFFGSAFQCASTIFNWSCHLQSPKAFICKFLKHCGEG